jgi:hypothetical protein
MITVNVVLTAADGMCPETHNPRFQHGRSKSTYRVPAPQVPRLDAPVRYTELSTAPFKDFWRDQLI